jgi:very-short-patch-repair endonuclease
MFLFEHMKRDRNIESEFLKHRRRSLRQFQTRAEKILWYELRASKRGYKIRRQVSINNFIVDFYCHEARLVIEIDGSVHDSDPQQAYDEWREGMLCSRGYTVLRFSNNDMLQHRDDVLRCIDDWYYVFAEIER